MTPHTIQLLTPAAVVLGAGIILKRLGWREYPALIAWMMWSIFFQGFAFRGAGFPHWLMIVQDVIAISVTSEVIRCSRFRLDLAARGRVVALALGATAFLAAIPSGLTPIQRAYLFRSYFLLIPCGVLLAVTLYRAVRPVLECDRHRYYRLGATAWLFLLAGCGVFVKGGLGYRILPYTMDTWKLVGLVQYWALLVTVGGMSAAMTWGIQRRKRAAKAMEVMPLRKVA